MEFSDLKYQYQRLKFDIDAGVQRVLDHGQYILGPEVAELEEKLVTYSGAKHCITVANGTDALQIAQMVCGHFCHEIHIERTSNHNFSIPLRYGRGHREQHARITSNAPGSGK